MLKWLWNRKAQEPKKKQAQPLACPSCKRPASKENQDRALVIAAGDDLICETCGAKRLRFDWVHAGQQAEIIKGLQEMADRSLKPPQSN